MKLWKLRIKHVFTTFFVLSISLCGSLVYAGNWHGSEPHESGLQAVDQPAAVIEAGLESLVQQQTQELRSRAWMGTRFGTADETPSDDATDAAASETPDPEPADPDAEQNRGPHPPDPSTRTGLLVEEVLGGTGERIGLMPGDRLAELNGQPVADMSGLLAILTVYREGDAVSATVVRNGKVLVLEGTFAAREPETHPNSEVIYTSAPFRDGLLRVIINRPPGDEPLPALLFIPGYTCASIANFRENHPYKRIIDAYVEAGYVTLRIEKSGLGDSWNTPECESTDLMDDIESFEQGLRKLKSLPYVDPSRIIIYGHSMGGVVAPAISARNDVAGVIAYGTTALSWFEYMLGLVRVQNRLAGMDPVAHEQSVVETYEMYYRFYIQGESLEDMAADARMDSLLRSRMNYDDQGRIYGRNPDYWRQIQHQPHLENWKNTTAQVLVQFGESDFQAYSLSAHEQIVQAVNHYHPGNATLAVFPLTDHYFALSGTMQEAYDKLIGGQVLQLFDEYNPEVGRSAVSWSNRVVGLD
jgi:uncharacterized protein